MNNAKLNAKKLSELLAIIRDEENLYYIDFSLDLDYDGKKDLVIKKSNQEFFNYVTKYTNKYIHDEEARRAWIYTVQDEDADEFELLVTERALLYIAYMNEKGLALADWERLIELDNLSLYYAVMQVFVRAIRKRAQYIDEVAKLYPAIFANEAEKRQ